MAVVTYYMHYYLDNQKSIQLLQAALQQLLPID